MKTTILISIALLFGLTISAQNFDAPTNSLYAAYENEKMSPDNNDPLPWCVSVNKNISDYNDPHPWIISTKNNMSPDNIPAGGYATKKTHYVKPPISYAPHANYSIKVRKPYPLIY